MKALQTLEEKLQAQSSSAPRVSSTGGLRQRLYRRELKATDIPRYFAHSVQAMLMQPLAAEDTPRIIRQQLAGIVVGFGMLLTDEHSFLATMGNQTHEAVECIEMWNEDVRCQLHRGTTVWQLPQGPSNPTKPVQITPSNNHQDVTLDFYHNAKPRRQALSRLLSKFLPRAVKASQLAEERRKNEQKRAEQRSKENWDSVVQNGIPHPCLCVNLLGAELRRRMSNSLRLFCVSVTRHRRDDETLAQSQVRLADFQLAYDRFCLAHSFEQLIIEENRDVLSERFLEIHKAGESSHVIGRRHLVFVFTKLLKNPLMGFVHEITQPRSVDHGADHSNPNNGQKQLSVSMFLDVFRSYSIMHRLNRVEVATCVAGDGTRAVFNGSRQDSSAGMGRDEFVMFLEARSLTLDSTGTSITDSVPSVTPAIGKHQSSEYVISWNAFSRVRQITQHSTVDTAMHKSTDCVALDGQVVTVYRGATDGKRNPPIKVCMKTLLSPDVNAVDADSTARKLLKADALKNAIKIAPLVDFWYTTTATTVATAALTAPPPAVPTSQDEG